MGPSTLPDSASRVRWVPLPFETLLAIFEEALEQEEPDDSSLDRAIEMSSNDQLSAIRPLPKPARPGSDPHTSCSGEPLLCRAFHRSRGSDKHWIIPPQNLSALENFRLA
ncbi:hypothetical protein PILCRDRAFT_557038 [Piloderma croceum F 1598]|uniref:Uncharacterized protein n=1 Tax=Piloderma croceum (strain F 1598) TaxID=765440 RepID=A0A0C3BQ74_PILCF|nr:hypothetical protein PILCRDRAFT_557038 [Piloderma croceum F 1598]